MSNCGDKIQGFFPLQLLTADAPDSGRTGTTIEPFKKAPGGRNGKSSRVSRVHSRTWEVGGVERIVVSIVLSDIVLCVCGLKQLRGKTVWAVHVFLFLFF